MIKIESKGNYLFLTNLETNKIISKGKAKVEILKNSDGTYDVVINEKVIFDNKPSTFFVDENENPFENFEEFYTLNSSFNPASANSLAVVEQNLLELEQDLENKQDTLGFTAENVANKQTDLTASATKYPTVDAVNSGINTKISKHVGATYTTSFVQTLTTSEYIAIGTKDAQTLYFIV